MSFNITFDDFDAASDSTGQPELPATIHIGSFSEQIHVPTEYWSKTRYIKQWIDALECLNSSPNAASALVTEIYNYPHNPRYAMLWWPLFREHGEVHVRYQYLLKDERPMPFDETRLYEYLPKRELLNDEGYQISEWTISFDHAEKFLKDLKGTLN
jgi:hypothetical protein